METAISLNKKAIEADGKQEYKEALNLYEQAVESYLYVLKHEVNGDKATASVREQCDKCLVRINELKKHKAEPQTSSFKLSSLFSKSKKNPDPPAVVKRTTLEKAIRLSSMAADVDKEGNHAEALRLYNEAIQHYQHALKYEVQKDDEAAMKKQFDKILQRVENLEKHLEKTPKESAEIAGEGASFKPSMPSPIDQNFISKITCTGKSLKKGIELATKAIDTDIEGKYEDALKLYNEALQCYLHALKYEVHQNDEKMIVRKQCDKLLTRAEEVKKTLKKSSDGVTALKKAIQLSAKATSADKEMKYKEAIGLYNLALEYYLHALKYEVKKYEKLSLKMECDKILQRAKELDVFLKKSSKEFKMAEGVGLTSFTAPPLLPSPMDIKMPNGEIVTCTGVSMKKAIQLSARATDVDEKGKYAEASKLYNEAIQYYLHALKFEVQSDKTYVIALCDKVIHRAEELDKHLKKNPKESESVKGASLELSTLQPTDQKPVHEITDLKLLMDKAVEWSMKATDADKEGKYEEAVKLYKEAFYYYIDAYKCAEAHNDKAKASIKTQCDRYLLRMTQLQMHLNSQAEAAAVKNNQPPA